MSRPLTEQLVLKKLGISDFRHLTKDNVISMASMLDKMNPEVAKEALEQFPNFSTTVKEIATEYKETIAKGIESNKESVREFYKASECVLDTMNKQLEKGDLAVEDRMKIMSMMAEITKRIDEKDSENKQFVLSMSRIALVVATATTIALVTALGGSTQITTNDSDKIN